MQTAANLDWRKAVVLSNPVETNSYKFDYNAPKCPQTITAAYCVQMVYCSASPDVPMP
jgi:hypothetical protein